MKELRKKRRIDRGPFFLLKDGYPIDEKGNYDWDLFNSILMPSTFILTRDPTGTLKGHD